MALAVVQTAVDYQAFFGDPTPIVLSTANAKWPGLPVAGNSMFLVANDAPALCTFDTCTDTEGNTFVEDYRVVGVNGFDLAFVRTSGMARASTPYAVDYNYTVAVGTFAVLGGLEVSGADTNPLLTQGKNEDTGTNTISVNSEDDISGDFIEISSIVYDNQEDIHADPPAGWTRFASGSSSSSLPGASAWRIVTGASSGPRSCTWLLKRDSDNSDYTSAILLAGIVAYKAAGGGNQTVAIGLATEADSAFGVTWKKVKAVGLAAETDSALAATKKKIHVIGLPVETDSALSATHKKVKAIGQSLETDSALAVVHAGQNVAIGQATETDASRPFTFSKAKAIGQATEGDFALGFAKKKLKAIGLVVETNSALAMRAARVHVIGLASETSSVMSFIWKKLKAIGQAMETDNAFSVTRPNPITGTVKAIFAALRRRRR